MKLTAFQLKCIAAVSMLVDHIGVVFFPDLLIFRILGRFAFPIFAFQLVEGFFHTKNEAAYLLRLGAFALLSEVPFDLVMEGVPLEFGEQNVFFTLFLGLAMMVGLKRLTGTLVRFCVIALACAFAALLSVDYGIMGILLILVFYLLREEPTWKYLMAGLWNLFSPEPFQYFGVAALVPIALYSGQRGRSLKWAFYIFYPAHLLLLYAIRMAL